MAQYFAVKGKVISMCFYNKSRCLTVLVVLFFCCLTGEVRAHEEDVVNTDLFCPSDLRILNQPSKSFQVTTIELLDKTVILLPPGDLYPFNIADPHRVSLSFQTLEYTKSSIPGAGNTRFYLKAGGNIGIFRVVKRGEPDHGWQFNIIGGFDALFDIDDSLDNIGWDGNYGTSISIDLDTRFIYKVGILHTSSHLGDEYIEKTGAARVGYTRHELLFGSSWLLSKNLRIYGETGWGFDLSNKALMDPWRLKGGAEYIGDEKIWNNKMSLYAAFDISSWQENDWQLDISAQTGLELNSGGRRARLGIEYSEGRVPLGEFFLHKEKYISLGLWVDI